MISTLFHRIPADSIEAVSYGVFRMGADFMGRMTQARGDSAILHHPFTGDDGLITYSTEEIAAVHRIVGRTLTERLGTERVTFVHG